VLIAPGHGPVMVAREHGLKAKTGIGMVALSPGQSPVVHAWAEVDWFLVHSPGPGKVVACSRELLHVIP
jgi:hypothetical protein